MGNRGTNHGFECLFWSLVPTSKHLHSLVLAAGRARDVEKIVNFLSSQFSFAQKPDVHDIYNNNKT